MEDFKLRSIDTVVDGEGIVHPKGSGFGGKFLRLPSEYREKLSKPIPKDMIGKHPTKTFLSVIKAIAVVERMNDVFGIDGWNLEHEIVDITEVKSKDGSVPYVVMKGRIYIRKYDLYTPYQYGGHQLGGRGTEPADGYKSAVTDIQSKCSSYLEIGIQVFKGQPMSQVANTSKVESEAEVVEQGVKNMTAKVTKEAPTPAPKKKAAPKKAAPKKTAAKKEKELEEEVQRVVSEGAEAMMQGTPSTMKEKEEVAPKKEEDKVTLQQESDDAEVSSRDLAIEKAMEEILSYKTAKDLKENAQVIIFNATVDGATEDDVMDLKAAINKRYKELLN